MNLYDSNNDAGLFKKTEAFYNHYRQYDSNHRKSGASNTLFQELINVFYVFKKYLVN